MSTALFIYPIVKPNNKVYLGYYHGIGYLSAVLKQHGHQTALLILDTFNADKISTAIARTPPDFICISATTFQYTLAQEICRYIARHYSIPILVGGIHAVIHAEKIINELPVQGVCYGEGEQALLAYAESVRRNDEPYDSPNFYFRLSDNSVIKTQALPPTDINTLPFPDREIFNFHNIIQTHPKLIGAEFMSSRGCPHRCAYCFNSSWLDIYGKQFIRRRSVKNMLDEIEYVVAQYPGIHCISFHDDYFTADPTWIEDFCTQYHERITIPFWINARADTLTEKMIRQLKHAGCFRIHIGVETGNEDIRREVLKKTVRNDEILHAFALVKRFGIKPVAFNMIGLPGETEENILETIAFNRRLQPAWIILSVFYPFPGTALSHYADCLSIGEKPAEHFYSSDTALNQHSISKERVQYYYKNFVKMVYMRS